MFVTRNKIGAASTIIGLALGVVGLAGAASSELSDRSSGGPKVTICHATGSEGDPYNKIEISQSAVDDEGHWNHTGPVWYLGASDAGVRWGDIIPATDGVTGLNWPAGESTFNNDCQLPGTTHAKDKTHGPKTTTTP